MIEEEEVLEVLKRDDIFFVYFYLLLFPTLKMP